MVRVEIRVSMATDCPSATFSKWDKISWWE